MTSKSTTMLKRRSAPSPLPWLPEPYMKKAVKWLVEHLAAALFLDPGLRKTSITLAAFSFLKKRGMADRMLVIAPLRVAQRVWPAEIAKWKDFNHLRVAVLHGKHKDTIVQSVIEDDAYDVLCINFEGLDWLLDNYGGSRAWRALGIDTLTVDELTKFKNSRGVRFKKLKKVLGTFQRRWGLTGTPAPNGLLDLFGQCLVLDQGASLGQFITHYRNQYFLNPDGQGWKWVPQAGAKEKIYEKLRPLALRMDADDYLKLPPVIDNYVELDLPPDVRKLYDELEEDLLAKVEDGVIALANAAAAGNSLWQICNGGLYIGEDVAAILKKHKMGMTKGKREALVLHDEKTNWLEELYNELQGQPLLIGYQFQHDLERLKARFGDKLITFTGKPKLDAEIEAAWNANEIGMLAAQQDAIAHGLNLQEGSAAHLAQYSNTWNLETWDQIIRRLRRSGTKAARIHRHIPVMRDTTDEDRRWAVTNKAKGQGALLEALKARRRGN